VVAALGDGAEFVVYAPDGTEFARFRATRGPDIDAVALTDVLPGEGSPQPRARANFIGFVGQWSAQLGGETNRRLADFGRFLCVRPRTAVEGRYLQFDPSRLRFLTRDMDHVPVITFSGPVLRRGQYVWFRASGEPNENEGRRWFCAPLSRTATDDRRVAISVDSRAASRARELSAHVGTEELDPDDDTSNRLVADLGYFEWIGDAVSRGVAPRGTRAEIGYWEAITAGGRWRGSVFLPVISVGGGLPQWIWVWADASLHASLGILQDGTGEQLVSPTSAIPNEVLNMEWSLSLGASVSGCLEVLDQFTACGGLGLDVIGATHLSGTNSSGGAVSVDTGYTMQPFAFVDVSTAFGM
jgi:hypothetical protein